MDRINIAKPLLGPGEVPAVLRDIAILRPAKSPAVPKRFTPPQDSQNLNPPG